MTRALVWPLSRPLRQQHCITPQGALSLSAPLSCPFTDLFSFYHSTTGEDAVTFPLCQAKSHPCAPSLENGLSSDSSMSDLCLMSACFYEQQSVRLEDATPQRRLAEVTTSAPVPSLARNEKKVPHRPPRLINNFFPDGDAL
ncbi:hypothetical protein STCU_10243 [Strigomonas culicis]|uniref:Uncharacterized protein n=1 Tax=Strigomonas culicis TaxID=28005 RepID=S9V566_9TRYP|nr:hypothetical protein STCU_10243 [Strigomonas culicis]|eukprot:EPY18025.1 hypothetical protein STCU_10243 [Strigomonas culicis]